MSNRCAGSGCTNHYPCPIHPGLPEVFIPKWMEDVPYVPPTPSPLLQEEVEIAAKLASQYPKIHHHAVGWRGPDDHVVFTDVDDFRAKTTLLTISPDAWCTMEHRHCACGSTLMVITAINDLEPWERTGGFHG